jgi:hypothetical protein
MSRVAAVCRASWSRASRTPARVSSSFQSCQSRLGSTGLPLTCANSRSWSGPHHRRVSDYPGRPFTRTRLQGRLEQLLDDGSGRIRPELQPLADSLLAMPKPTGR